MNNSTEPTFETDKAEEFLTPTVITHIYDPEQITADTPPSKEREMAQAAFARLSDDFTDSSPSNPKYDRSISYRTSRVWLNRHAEEITEQLETDFSNLSFQWAQHDKMQIQNVDRHPGRKKAADIANFANNGIRSILNEFSEVKFDRTQPADHINRLSVRAISALIVRRHYLKELASREPEVKNILGDKPFDNMFDQNIRSAVQHAGLMTESDLYCRVLASNKPAVVDN